jgi:hypothetical protein
MSTTTFWREKCNFWTVWPGASPTQNKATAIKTRSRSRAYCDRLDLLAQKILTCKKLQILLNILGKSYADTY